ncbi:MAG: alginate O-acetyltransferase complex protein AlgI [Parvicella sp.]|jgi:alginate O-acetyltransferase complex protein AlgI
MLFNSIEFALFLPLVFVLYWFVFKKNLRYQNLLLLIASYVFYGWWDYRFLLLIFISTIVDFIVGKNLSEVKLDDRRGRNLWLAVSVIFNLGLLVFFKYYNFFVESWVQAFSSIGYETDPWTLNIILPVGISFYTFQTMSYTLDIYKGKLEPTRDFLGFATFVSFFPQLVAGPIERASNLLPQILSNRKFSYNKAVSGLRLILWGLVKKVVFADSLAPVVNEIFENYTELSSGTLILGAVYFAFQIYCDFSGYSDIARGVAKLFGFELMLNFNFPYFSRSIGEFWRKWHISLSTWFRDYLYIPLGGSKGSKWKGVRNVFIIFIVSGFWHGANWTFIIWGGIHALLFVPSFILGTNRTYHKPILGPSQYIPSLSSLFRVAFTFSLVCIAWVFFRAESTAVALDYLKRILTLDLIPDKRGPLYFYVIPLIILEVLLLTQAFFKVKHRAIRFSVYVIFVFLVLRFSVLNGSADFIYFQF